MASLIGALGASIDAEIVNTQGEELTLQGSDTQTNDDSDNTNDGVEDGLILSPRQIEGIAKIPIGHLIVGILSASFLLVLVIAWSPMLLR